MKANIPLPHVHDHLTHPKYRPDIDGLRAVAILAVVGFHAFPSWIKGGFIGVDIFFVISGYLISTIIIGSLERDSFSFTDFYKRRIRRIFPSLFVVLAACLVCGWFVLLADEYGQLGKHVAGGAGFVANFMFWSEAGYFDNAADTKPLLHLWSLGIEEQFYLVWPLLLWLVWKREFNLLTVTVVIAVISFALGVHKVRSDMVAAFYSPQTRFWELLAGSILAYMALHKITLAPRFVNWADMWLGRVVYAQAPEANGTMLRNFLSLSGALLIVIGIWLITRDKPFPGVRAMLPVLGAILIIAAGARAWINRVVLSNRVMVWFGLISFPLYLWHWPLLSFARIMSGRDLSDRARVAAVLAAIVLAWLTYWLVERPVRSGGNQIMKVIILFVLMVTVGSAGYCVIEWGGFPSRAFQEKFDAFTASIIRSERERECFELPGVGSDHGKWFCDLGEKSIAPKYFMYGDSHALSLLPALEKFSRDTHSNALFSGMSSCPPLLGVELLQSESGKAKHDCQKFNEQVFQYVKQTHISSVVLVGRWTYYTVGTTKPDEHAYISVDVTKEASQDSSRDAFRHGLRTTIAKYKDIGVHVLIVKDNPQQRYAPVDVAKRHMLSGEEVDRFSVHANEHSLNQAWVAKAFDEIRDSGASILDLDDILCRDQRCPLMVNDKFIYFDDDHLSIDGAMLLYPKLKKLLDDDTMHH